MLSSAVRAAVAVLLSITLTAVYAQQTQFSITVPSVPRAVRITSAFRPANGLPAAAVESVTLSIYKDDHDLTPLWQETQNVALDAEGRYTVLMGSSLSEGMPLELFSAGEPRWLGVQFNRAGESEQPRVLLVSVPYALKAADADTLGGRPASAYLLSPAATARDEKSGAAANKVSKSPDTADAVTALTSGTTGAIAKFVNASDLGDSVVYENNSQIGVGTTTPFDKLHVQFTDTSGCCTGYAVRNLGSGANSYSGMLFYDQAGALAQFQGFNNSTHEYRINNIASGGSINFMIGGSSKFLVANNGNVGIGTATPGSKLDVAGGVNATVLSLPATTNATTGVVTLGGNRFLHNFGGNTFLGTNAGTFVTSGTGSLSNTGVGSSALASNTTGGSNTATGASALRNNTSGGGNTATGAFALLNNTGGFGNTATGASALSNNTTGYSNTATGSAALFNNTTGGGNTATGGSALSNNTTGYYNTATGASALSNNTTGYSNTATGGSALLNNTTGGGNTATGAFTLLNNTTGGGNTATGDSALLNNTTGCCNTATGLSALNNNTSGFSNTATGHSALLNNTTGCCNTATGQGALNSNTSGFSNTAIGHSALLNNTIGCCNTATGQGALNNNTSGFSNTATGQSALLNNTTGVGNTALGVLAGMTGDFNNANTTGSNNTFIGFQAGPATPTQLNNATAIGANAVVSSDNTLVLGAATVSVAIGTSTAATKLQVVGDIRVGTTGTNGCIQNNTGGPIAGTCSSDVRLKQNIEPFSPVLDKVVQLQPVSYQWKADEHPEYHFGSERTTGLIAQDVEKLLPEMVATDEHGYKAVNYSQIPLLLLQAVRELKAENDSLREELSAIKAGLGMRRREESHEVGTPPASPR